MKTKKRFQKPKKQFCDAGWVTRMKEAKADEYRRRGETIPEWLIPRPAPGEQRKLDFEEGQAGDGLLPTPTCPTKSCSRRPRDPHRWSFRSNESAS